MEDWRGAYQALNEGFQYAPEDASFSKDLELVKQKINQIKTEFLKNMVIFFSPGNNANAS